jgi:hypothetical protein
MSPVRRKGCLSFETQDPRMTPTSSSAAHPANKETAVKVLQGILAASVNDLLGQLKLPRVRNRCPYIRQESFSPPFKDK